ncbi:DUF4258 domain-containing protein [Baaleninema simplex]|uniref:DUF4258 domain-containing protein n=1 Tax=Baaleninema simplex TaxID=2862350 RepID=UPI00192CDFC7|nr:DUF4258 domain-containing protein [Baaleninema simplex]
MKIEEIKSKVKARQYVYTSHGDTERKADGLMVSQVREAILNGEILEQYPDTGRGESCLILGFANKIPIHIVCGWRGKKVAIITVYIPRPPNFLNSQIRSKGETNGESEM